MVPMNEYYFNCTGTRAPGSAEIPTDTDDPNDEADDNGGLSTGAIVGIVFGSLVGLSICCKIGAALLYCFCKDCQ